MLKEPLFRYSQEVSPISTLPNIHPESIDCVIRSQSPSKGSLYVSNLEGAENIELIKSKQDPYKELKVTSILTCASGYRLDHPPELKLDYKYFPLPQNSSISLNEYLKQASKYLRLSLLKSNCLVHCLTGQSKSIAVIISYLIKQYNMTFNDSLSYVQRKRKFVKNLLSQINLEKEYIQALKLFQKTNKKKISLNETQNHAITYKTQNSKFEETPNQSKISNNSLKIILNPEFSQNQFKSEKFLTASNELKTFQKVSSKLSERSYKNQISKNLSKSPQIHSIPNTNIISVNHSRINQKVKTQNIFINKSFSVDHKESAKFDNILSCHHQNFVGVKRELKKSITSSKKSQSSMVKGRPKNSISLMFDQSQNYDNLQVQNSFNKSKLSDKKLLQVNSFHYLQGQEASKDQNSKSKKNKSKLSVSSLNASQIELKNSHLREQTEQLELSKILSPPFRKKSSKIHYYLNVNEELNSNMNKISTAYESQINDLRIKYQNRLCQLKQIEKSSTSCV